LSVMATVPGKTPVDSAGHPDLANAQNAVKNGIAGKPLLANLTAGQSVTYAAVVSAIEALIPGTPLTVTALTISATSQADGRTQSMDAVGMSIHVRSVEIANVHSISLSAITSVTVVGTQPQGALPT